MTKEDKKEWARSLKVGDVVCDCRLKHLKIKEIIDQESDNVYDMVVILEDDAHCSVMNCCDPVSHDWKHN